MKAFLAIMKTSKQRRLLIMRKNLTEIVFILDRSGSMNGLEADTIGGYNSFLEKQKNGKGDAYISTVLFDNEIIVLHDRENIKDVKLLTSSDYEPRGLTALLDAVGGAIKHIGNVHKYAREEDVPEKTIFVIITDGMENASHKYTYNKVNELIKRKQEEFGWEFVFLGANIDAPREARKFGISESRSVTYKNDEQGVANNYSVVDKMVSAFRLCSCDDKDFESDKEALFSAMRREIDEDVKKRGK